MKIYIDDKYADTDDLVTAIVVDKEAFEIIAGCVEATYQIAEDVEEDETPYALQVRQIHYVLKKYQLMEGGDT